MKAIVLMRDLILRILSHNCNFVNIRHHPACHPHELANNISSFQKMYWLNEGLW